MKRPARAMAAMATRRIELAYPGTLSMPLVGWRCGDGPWRAAISDSLERYGVVLRVRLVAELPELSLECAGPCRFVDITAGDDWRSLAPPLRAAWKPPAGPAPLAARYRELRYYVHKWLAPDSPDDPVRTDWTGEALVAEMQRQPPDAMIHVWGIDPGGNDLRGEYFGEPGAAQLARRVVAANPRAAHFTWLNLRSYKYAVPARGIDEAPSVEVRAMARLYPEVNAIAQYTFKAWEMCLGSRGWQRSRMRQLERLVGLGYKVVALDEFPMPARWDVQGCRSSEHLHRAGDLADEWRVTIELVRRLARYAAAHGVLLSSEEPSAALLPFVSGYVDRIANRDPDVYAWFRKGTEDPAVPLFSTVFGDRMTPYTDLDPSGPLPRGWLPMRKVARPDGAPAR
jgi:hypothetical protein